MQQAIIFDMDGVLIDSEPLWREAEKTAFAKVGMHLTDDDCKLTMGFRTSEVMDFWWDRSPWHGMTKQELEQDIIVGVGKLINGKGQAMPGVVSTLVTIKENGWKIGLASSSPMVLIEAVLEKLAISEYFEVVHSAQFEKQGKPHPAVYLTAAKKLGVEPENCWVVEDSVYGMEAGLRAGMRVVAIPAIEDKDRPEFKKANGVFSSILDIKKLL